MLQALNIILLASLIVTALAACLLRNLLAAVVMLGAFSLIMGIMWVMLRAPDLALAEVAAIGVVSTIFFVVTIFKTERKEE
jgi:energy-converting hydrogenase B subunit D